MNDLIITFGGSLIFIMLGLIGYFLNRLVMIIDKLEETVNKMQISFAEQRLIVSENKLKIQQIEKKCEIKHQ